MIKIKIKNKRYRIFTTWKEINAGKAIEADRVSAPTKLLKLIFEQDSEKREKIVSTITDDEAETFTEYYRKIIEIFSNIPGDVVNGIYAGYVDTLFTVNLYPLVYQMKNLYPDIEPKLINRFGLHFFRHVKIEDVTVPMIELLIEKFTEMQELAKDVNGVVWAAATLLSDSETKIVKNYRHFKKRPMNKVWELFFYTFQFLPVLQNHTLDYLKAKKQHSTASEPGACYSRWQRKESPVV